MDEILAIAARHNLRVVEDTAQAFGAAYRGRPVGALGDCGTVSFYPTKNLGAYGDGGAVVTSDPALAERVRRLRNYGQEDRYHHAERGQNSRLDEMQAAILRVKLAHLDEHNAVRRELAGEYSRRLTGVTTPACRAGADPVFHLYVVRHPRRDAFMKALKDRGIGTLIHYPVPVHLQEGYRDLGYAPGSLPVTERVAREILSLPLYVGLTPERVSLVSDAINEWTRTASRT
jgi:dTDP-4-amino-4,6-dideoxygalactose transaminase